MIESSFYTNYPPRHRKETDLYRPFTKMMDSTIRICKQCGVLITMPLKFIPHGTKPLRDSQAMHRPDAVRIAPDAFLPNGQASWKDVHIVVEIKQSKEYD